MPPNQQPPQIGPPMRPPNQMPMPMQCPGGPQGVPPGVRPQMPGQQQQQPGPPQPQPKQNRVTTLPKPCGIDPIVVLQERENRCVKFLPNPSQHFSVFIISYTIHSSSYLVAYLEVYISVFFFH